MQASGLHAIGLSRRSVNCDRLPISWNRCHFLYDLLLVCRYGRQAVMGERYESGVSDTWNCVYRSACVSGIRIAQTRALVE